MPIKPKKPCTYPGCGAYATHGARCEQHKHADRNAYDALRGNSGQRGYDRQWQLVRNRKISEYPLCERCLASGRGAVIANVVHHINPVDKYPELRLIYSNLESLCNECHEREHGRKS